MISRTGLLKSITFALVLLFATGGSAIASSMWCAGSPDWGTGASGPSPTIFEFDTTSGTITQVFTFGTYNWLWISGLADSGSYLYATHNEYDVDPTSTMDQYDFKVAKIDRETGAVLSDTSIAGFLGQTYSQVNALNFNDGKLYGVENATSGSTIRGYAMQILLDASGDVVGATRGAFVGPWPDGGLDFHNGVWYATSWGYTSSTPKKQGSNVLTSPDIMSQDFVLAATGNPPSLDGSHPDNDAVQGMGMIDGWDLDSTGNLMAVTWYPETSAPATGVYTVDPSAWTATLDYDLVGQLPGTITSLSGLVNVATTPIPTLSISGLATLFVVLLSLGIVILTRRR